jgi:hypothetical protein
MEHLNLSSQEAVEVFPCPNCKETINTSMRQCPFCSAPVDHNAAITSAASFGKLNQACSDASYFKATFGLAFTCLVAPLAIPRIPIPVRALIGVVPFTFFLIVGTVMTIRWWVKFSSIQTDDPDFTGARGSAKVIGIVAIILILVVIIGYAVILPAMPAI